MADAFDRREFLVTAAAAGLGLTLDPGRLAAAAAEQPPAPAAQEPRLLAAPPIETVRMGFVGVGHQGASHVRNFLRIEGVEIRAVCDIVPEKAARIQKWVVEASSPTPTAP